LARDTIFKISLVVQIAREQETGGGHAWR